MKINCVLSTSRIPPNMESIRIHCNTKQPNGSKDGIHQALWSRGFVLMFEGGTEVRNENLINLAGLSFVQ